MDILDDPSDRIVYTEDIPYVPEPGGLGKIFFTRMASYGDAKAQINGNTGEIDSYNDFLRRCVRTAITMRNMGIQPGDVISTCSYNHFNCAVPFIAGLFIGAVSANLDPALSITDTTRLIHQVQPKMIFVGQDAVELIESCLDESQILAEIVVFGESEKYLEFSKFLEPVVGETAFKPIEVDLDSTAVICFSSGTSGFPKGICLPHLGIFYQLMRSSDIGYNMEGFLGFASMYWCSSIFITGACIIHKGCKIVVPKFDIDTVWAVLSKIKVTSMFIATYHAILMSRKGRPTETTTNLKQLATGGTYIGAQLVDDLEKMVPECQIVVGYGLTEACGTVTCFRPRSSEDVALFKRKPSSVGRALPGFTLKIVDLDTEEVLGPFKHGELLFKGSIKMNGYYRMDSSEVRTSDGWIKTGDIAYYDDEKCFYIVDRLKEIMKVKSYSVSPAAIEEVLLGCQYVEAAVVIGVPHPIDGQHPVAIVVLKQDSINKISAEDIVKYVDDRVDDFKKLRGGVRLVDSIPVTPTGKICRPLIKSTFFQGLT